MMPRGAPTHTLNVPIASVERRAFASAPQDAQVVARFADGAPGVLSRPVGKGRVIAFASDPMAPAALVQPLDLVALMTAIQRSGGGAVGDPAWDYRLP